MKLNRAVVPCLAGLLSSLAFGASGPTGLAWLEISGTPIEQPSPFAWLGLEEGDTLRSLVERIDEVTYQDGVEGLVIRLKDAGLGTTHIQELGEALNRVRASGKKVHVFAENYGTAELLLGSFADEVLIQSGGAVSLPGMYMEEMFLRDTLEWIGLRPDFVQIGDYKGASEAMMNSEPSGPWEENISGLLDSLYENMRDMIKQGRGLNDAELDRAMERAWWASDTDAIELGLIDGAVDLPVLMDHLEESYGGEVEIAYDLNETSSGFSFDAANPFAIFSMLSAEPKHVARRPTIAVLHIDGAIIDGDSTPAGILGGAQVGSRTIRNAIEDIIDQDMIKGVVVRIDSPGGSAIASEIIWQGLQRLKEEKPVWVSVGSMAASGGYYIAVGGSKIYANPSSIVGSIGVVGGKIAMGGLYDKVHLNVVERTRGPMAGLMGSKKPWTDSERELIRQRMTETYDQFVGRVVDGREGIDISKTAEGRLFVGPRARELNMVDEIGGLDDALHDLAAEIGLDDFEVMDFPGPKSFAEMIEEMFGGVVSSPSLAMGQAQLSAAAAALREILGPQRFEVVRDAMNASIQLREEPVLLTMPRVILFH
ncbi:MAG: signal peptide peptidase SppA [Planctomycetota bacterium]|nr:MAG: signal peptide peptidase SppA [Planctomycetota bacterium]